MNERYKKKVKGGEIRLFVTPKVDQEIVGDTFEKKNPRVYLLPRREITHYLGYDEIVFGSCQTTRALRIRDR